MRHHGQVFYLLGITFGIAGGAHAGHSDEGVNAPRTGANEFVYAANQAAHNISGYRVDPDSGKLTALPGAPFKSGTNPVAIASAHDGRFVYATNQGSATVSAYAVNQDTGTLTMLPGAPYQVGDFPDAIAISPADRYVYVTNEDANRITPYRVNPATGDLTRAAQPAAPGAHPLGITISHAGRFAYDST